MIDFKLVKDEMQKELFRLSESHELEYLEAWTQGATFAMTTVAAAVSSKQGVPLEFKREKQRMN